MNGADYILNAVLIGFAVAVFIFVPILLIILSRKWRRQAEDDYLNLARKTARVMREEWERPAGPAEGD